MLLLHFRDSWSVTERLRSRRKEGGGSEAAAGWREAS